MWFSHIHQHYDSLFLCISRMHTLVSNECMKITAKLKPFCNAFITNILSFQRLWLEILPWKEDSWRREERWGGGSEEESAARIFYHRWSGMNIGLRRREGRLNLNLMHTNSIVASILQKKLLTFCIID